MTERAERLEEDLYRLTNALIELRHKYELMERVFIVKEPDAVRAAEAYDGLRRQVIAANGERRAHLAQLVDMAVATHRATSVADIAGRVEEWLGQAGIVRLAHVPEGGDWRQEDLFEVIDGGPGRLALLEPAYVDGATNAILRRGRLTHVTEEPAPVAAAPVPASVPSGPDPVPVAAEAADALDGAAPGVPPVAGAGADTTAGASPS